jgi:Ca2+-binding RTX toxin-like protein
MAVLRHLATLSSGVAELDIGITDLVVAQLGGAAQLYATSCAGGGGISAFAIPTSSPAQLLSQQFYGNRVGYLATPQLNLVQQNGFSFLLPSGMYRGYDGAYSLLDGGSIGARFSFARASLPPADLLAVVPVSLGSVQYLIASRTGIESPQLFELGADRSLRSLDSGQAANLGAAMTAMTALHFTATAAQIAAGMPGKGNFILGVSALGNRICSYSLAPDGGLSLVQAFDSLSSGIGFDTPVALATASVAGAQFAIIASMGSSSLSVMRIGFDGKMLPVDHVVDGLPTRFGTVSSVETISLGERVFVLAGGGDDGLSLFTQLPDGRLLHLSSLADTDAMTLNNVSAIAASTVAGQVQVFVTSGVEAGISQLILDVGTPGLTRQGEAGPLTGSPQDDLLLAGQTTTLLAGGQGDDILVAATQAAGALHMWGGLGNDIFVPASNGRVQWLMDYQPGLDQLDLSLFPMLRSLEQMEILSTATGASLRFGDTLIILVTNSATPLSRADFLDNALLALTRYAPWPEPELLTGTTSADRIALGSTGGEAYGLEGNDTIWGGTADAVIGGGPGDDQIWGVSGFNQIWGGYGRDTIQGGDGRDAIWGGGSEANLLFGNDGSDTLWGGDGGDQISGGAGGDTVLGGAGDDSLYGGFDNDLIGGGSGNDAIWDGAGNNQIWGGLGNDQVYGGAGHDIIYGGDGADQLYLGQGYDFAGGGGGNDLIVAGTGAEQGASRIYAGYGDDTLRAGSGRDVVTGGPGADQFVFASAAQAGSGLFRDEITDFAPGIDHLDLRMMNMPGSALHWQSGIWFSATAAEVLYLNGLLIGDVNADGRADFVIALSGAPALHATDLWL